MSKKLLKANCLFGARFMLTQIDALQSEIEGALVGEDIEHVHQMRVASRRMRNGLNLFGDCLSKKKSATWGDEIRKITKALGKARDLDIQISLLNESISEEMDPRIKPGYNRLLLRRKQQRTKTQEKVTRTLVDLQEGGILDQMQVYLREITEGSENIYLYTPSLYQQAFVVINTHLDEFLNYEKFIYDPQNIEKLHAMRITGKHLRYTLEIFAPIYGTAIEPHIRAMKDIQDLLGEIHDNDVWIAWLPNFIEKEQARIEDYFGNMGPLRRLLPGLNHFLEGRQAARDHEYHAFLSIWETLQYEKAWTVLREIIKAPINIEAAMTHMAPDAAEVPFEPKIDDGAPESGMKLPSEDVPVPDRVDPVNEPTQDL